MLALVAALVALAAGLAACGDDGAPQDEPGNGSEGLELRSDGLGAVAFGETEAAATTKVVEVLGNPDHDDTTTGDRPDGLGDQGTTLRLLRWGGFSVSFIDWTGSPYRTDGQMHFVRWILTSSDSAGHTRLTTAEGLTVGSTAADVRRVYGDRAVITHDECVGAWTFHLRDAEALGLRGRFDRDPSDPAAALTFLSAGLQSSC